MENESLKRVIADWTTDVRIENAATQRRQVAMERRIAAEESRFASVLADLSERQSFVTLTLDTNAQRSGRITEIGTDFVALESMLDASPTAQALTYLRASCINGVETESDADASSSLRLVSDQRCFNDVLWELGEARTSLRFLTRNSTSWRHGTLTAAGVDVATIRLDVKPPRTLFVPTEQITQVQATETRA